MKRGILLTAMFLLAALCGGLALYTESGGPPANEAEYLYQLREAGLEREKSAAGLRLRLRCLPPDYMAWRELQNRDSGSPALRDSLLEMYKGSRAFLLTIAPEKGESSGDVMYKDIHSYEEYAVRLKTVNFGLQHYCELRTPQRNLAPALSFMENVYSLHDECRMLLLFTPARGEKAFEQDEDLDLVFYDEIFNTGIHHFRFSAAALYAAPPFPFDESE